jgi:hypothetical protein
MSTQDFTTGLSDMVRYDDLISTPPPLTSSLAYDENVIVFLITRIWEMFVALGYVKSGDIVFAWTNGHRLDDAVVAEVVSLIRRLPAVRPGSYMRQEFAPGVLFLSFIDGRHVRMSRDPAGMIAYAAMDGKSVDPMRPTDVMIGEYRYGDSDTWVLDAEASKRDCIVWLIQTSSKCAPSTENHQQT